MVAIAEREIRSERQPNAASRPSPTSRRRPSCRVHAILLRRSGYGGPVHVRCGYGGLETRGPANFRVLVGYRFYEPEAGRWVNRDPIEEKGLFSGRSGLPGRMRRAAEEYTTYIYADNMPITKLDYLGLSSLASKIWDAAKQAGMNVSTMFQESLKHAPASGAQAELGVIAGPFAALFGSSAMFFPETCQFGKYWYESGTLEQLLSAEEGQNLLQQDEWWTGLSFGGMGPGGSLVLVEAAPIGIGSHGPDSWLGWAWNVEMATTPLPVLGGLGAAGSVFKSRSWSGGSIGVSVLKPGIGFVWTYYRFAGLHAASEPLPSCLCWAARCINRQKPQLMGGIAYEWGVLSALEEF